MTSLPKKLNKRTGKARNSLFEEVDLKMYEKGANMVAFHTSIERIYPWIKTLDSFYYDHLGRSDSYIIKWYDEPEIWEDSTDSTNSIVVEVREKDNSLAYNVTFFITTGTIRAQGSKYMLFVEKHFPILKRVLSHILSLKLPHSLVENTEKENRSSKNESRVVEIDDETTLVKTAAQAQSQDKLSEEHLVNLHRFESSMTDAIGKLEASQGKDMNYLVTLINQSNDACLRKLHQCASELEEIKDVCLSLTKFKMDVTETLERMEKQLKTPMSYSQAVQSTSNVGDLQTKHDTAAMNPSVLLIGTSNVKGINENKLTPFAEITKVVKYTMKETREFIQTCNLHPDILVLHSLTNDLTKMEPQTCVDVLESLIQTVKSKWQNAVTILSLATPRLDKLEYHTNGQITNAILKQRLSEEPMLLFCDHSNMLTDGNPTPEFLAEDQYHLSVKGTSLLAANIRKSIHTFLNIHVQDRGRSRSRFRNNNRRGRGRGYMNMKY
jgi:hypothetical protein